MHSYQFNAHQHIFGYLQDILLFITCGAGKGPGQFLLTGPETAVTRFGSK